MKRRRFLQATAATPALWLSGCGQDTPIAGSVYGASHKVGHRLRESGGLPLPTRHEKVDVLILGGGIAGLAAGHRLAKSAVSDFLILDLEAQAGGNSVSGKNAVSAYPWGAHYVPLPGPDCHEVRQLFEELGVITGHDAAGRPIYDETALCSDPHERLFIHGEWQEGLLPVAGTTEEEQRQLQAFQQAMHDFSEQRGKDGLPAFTLPMERSSRDPELLALDLVTMGDWMSAQGWTAKPLRWLVDYSCRDDYGGSLDEVSAWAGIHYFASRHADAANAEHDAVLTWPEGNGWLVQQLTQKVADRLRCQSLVMRVNTIRQGLEVDVMDVPSGEVRRITCRAAICAMPRFIAQHLLPLRMDWPTAPTYSPWAVTNMTLSELPPSPGELPAWDSVVYDGPTLGYVNATHQKLQAVPDATVITHYEALCGKPPAEWRQWMLEQSHAQWCERSLKALAAPHPDLARYVEQMDVWLWGHGMIRPVPGFVSGSTRAAMCQQQPPLFFAHSDMSGLSLFEEAYTRGIEAAEALQTWLGASTT